MIEYVTCPVCQNEVTKLVICSVCDTEMCRDCRDDHDCQGFDFD